MATTPISKKSTALRQQPLPFPSPHPSYRCEDFFVDPANAEAYQAITATAPSSFPRKTLWIIGEAGCGKSHLVSIWRQIYPLSLCIPHTDSASTPNPDTDTDPASPDKSQISLGQPQPAFPSLSPSLPSPLILSTTATSSSKITTESHPQSVICEDIEKFPERRLLYIMNLAHESNIPIILTSRSPVEAILPDLKSRLKSSYCCRIGHPGLDLIKVLIYKFLADAQLEVQASAVDYLAAQAASKGIGFAQLQKLLHLAENLINAKKSNFNKTLAKNCWLSYYTRLK